MLRRQHPRMPSNTWPSPPAWPDTCCTQQAAPSPRDVSLVIVIVIILVGGGTAAAAALELSARGQDGDDQQSARRRRAGLDRTRLDWAGPAASRWFPSFATCCFSQRHKICAPVGLPVAASSPPTTCWPPNGPAPLGRRGKIPLGAATCCSPNDSRPPDADAAGSTSHPSGSAPADLICRLKVGRFV